MIWYFVFLGMNAAEMIGESRVAARNSAELVKKGAVEVAPRILSLMILLYIVMYIGCFFESLAAGRTVPLWWAISFLALFLLAKLLKWWAVSSLGGFWTMKVLILPGAGVVRSGPYRYIRHPNYVAVLLEIAATALTGKCFYTFGFVFLAFVAVLFFRIHAEETALIQYTDYSQKMTELRRFIP